MAWLAHLAPLGLLLIAGGLAWSHSLVSIGVGFTIALAILIPTFRQELYTFYRELSILSWPWVVIFGLHLLSYAYTENTAQWLKEIQIKLPMPLLLSATVVLFSKLSHRQQSLVLWLFHAGILIVGVATVAKALLNFTWALEEMQHSRYVPMVGGISHIYYAGHLISALLLLFVTPGPRWSKGIVAFGHLLIMHVLALRTALFAFYGGLVIVVIYWMIRHRQWLLGSGLLIAVAVFFWGLIQYWGPFKSRYENLQRDIQNYFRGDLYHLTVGTRLAALEASWLVFCESPLWGVGIADNQDAVHAKEAELPYHWEPKFYLLPHHQFVEYAIGFGIIGLGVFLAFWVGAFWRERHEAWWLWLLGWILLMQVEAFLERQMGLTMFLWGTGLLWVRLRQRSS